MSLPTVGSPAPPLDVVDAYGQPVTRDAVSGPRGLVLGFYRGAW